MDCIVHGVAKSWTQLSDFHSLIHSVVLSAFTLLSTHHHLPCPELFHLPGVGCGSARMMLSSLTTEEVRAAIIGEDISKIKSVKGIGLKTAQRLVVDLKDKIVKGSETDTTALFQTGSNAVVEEATTALVMLGYTKAAVGKVIPSILKDNPSAKVEQIIKAALQKL